MTNLEQGFENSGARVAKFERVYELGQYLVSTHLLWKGIEQWRQTIEEHHLLVGIFNLHHQQRTALN